MSTAWIINSITIFITYLVASIASLSAEHTIFTTSGPIVLFGWQSFVNVNVFRINAQNVEEAFSLGAGLFGVVWFRFGRGRNIFGSISTGFAVIVEFVVVHLEVGDEISGKYSICGGSFGSMVSIVYVVAVVVGSICI